MTNALQTHGTDPEMLGPTSRGTKMTRGGVAFSDQGEGPAIVFIHGVSFDRVTWSPILRALEVDHRCVALDLPGHGETTAAGTGMDASVDAIADVVSELGLERPLIVGHSAGAVYGSFYAARHPVAGVVNVDQPLMAGEFAKILHRLKSDLYGSNFREAFRFFERTFGYELIPEDLRALAEWRCRPRQEVVLAHWAFFLTQMPEVAQAETERRLAGVYAPYFVVHTRDYGPEYEAWLRATMPKAEVTIEVWPGLGHFPHLADLDRFVGLLRVISRCVLTTSWPSPARP